MLKLGAVDAVTGNGHAAGILFVAPDGDILLLRRSSIDENWAGHWDMPGGKGDEGETPEATAGREAGEEIGSIPSTTRKLFDSAVTPRGMVFHTFVQASDKFAPTLSDEHTGYCWAPIDMLPQPLHPGIKRTLDRRLMLDLAGAMSSEEVTALKTDFADWARVEHAPVADQNLSFGEDANWTEGDHPRASNGEFGGGAAAAKHDEPVAVKEYAGGSNGSALPFVREFNDTYRTGKAAKEALGKAPNEKLQRAHKAMRGHVDPSTKRMRDLVEEEATRRGLSFDGRVAMDRDTVRRFDADGHMKVELTPISKANVCPYYGREIPDYQILRLEPDKVYRLYRDAMELAKAAPTFAGKQLLMEHIPVNAEDPHREVTVGSIGDGVVFNAPYLMAPLSIFDGEAIELIESEKQKELSSAYRYRADMTPGTSPQGEPYDGVMRDISGNHVALVAKGRAGSDVLVHDELPSGLDPEARNGPAGPENSGGSISYVEFSMSKTTKLSLMAATATGALMTYLKPKLAQDAKIDLTPILAGVTAKNFKAKQTDIMSGLTTATSGKLAKDATLDGVADVLTALDGLGLDEMEANSGTPMAGKTPGKDKAKDEDPDEKRREFLKDKLSEDDMSAYDALCEQEAMDEEEDDDKVDKKAMDAAIADAVKTATENANRTQRDIREAEEVVRPYVGKLAMAHDSAAGVFRTALGALGVKDVDKLHPDALKPILLAMPLPNTAKPAATVAMDAAGVTSFFERYPEAKNNPVKTL